LRERSPALTAIDDCGFFPFGDDVSTARETAFGKIPRSRREYPDRFGQAGTLSSADLLKR
jgi:hypothetical protein